VASLGGSENATQKQKDFQAKWLHLATRKMRQNREAGAWRMNGCESATLQACFRRNSRIVWIVKFQDMRAW
jgi:hypothetical protein